MIREEILTIFVSLIDFLIKMYPNKSIADNYTTLTHQSLYRIDLP